MTVHFKQDEPDKSNRLDGMKQGVLGKGISRVEGLAKVTGTAPYAAEYPIEGCAEGVLVTSTITRGEVTGMDRDAVLAMPGVLALVDDPKLTTRAAQGTADEAPKQGPKTVCYWGQPIALVVAETFEQARDAAKHLAVEYREDEGAPIDPQAVQGEEQEDETVRQGDLAQAIAEAAHSVDVTYTTKGHASAAMEPHAAIAQWDGDKLTVHASLQMLNYNISELADALDMEEDQIRLISRYVGGGFGSKLGISEEVVAAAIAAKELARPVRVVLTRQQVFQCIMRRSETTQRLRLAADKNGAITGFGHHALVSNLPGETFAEPVLQSSHFLYAGENRELKLEVARIHRMTAGSVRDGEGALTPWSHHPDIHAAAQAGAFQLRQDVDALYRMLPVWLGEFMRLVDEGLIDPDAVDWFAIHYSAHSLREEMARLATKAGCMIPEERWYSNLATKGNVGAASIFLILDDLMKSGKLEEGQTVLCAVPESGQCVMAYAGMTVVGPNDGKGR